MRKILDNGSRIPSAERARVFDRFYCGAMADVRGTGLGLRL
ncbi:MAG: hypothetical protein ABI356_13240 [Steroidobacteraceae bacterium]